MDLPSHLIIYPPPVVFLLAPAHNHILISPFRVRPFPVGLNLGFSVSIHAFKTRLLAKTQTLPLFSTYGRVPWRWSLVMWSMQRRWRWSM